jgi:nitroreductase
MTVYETIENRRSIRAYKNRPVEQEKLDRILEAARKAPSASNRQEWRFVVVRDEALRHRLMAAASNQGFVGEAPVVIACCAETDGHVMRCGQQCYPIDVAIAIDHLTLAATEEGLGTCWIGAFSEREVKDILGIPASVRVVQLLTLGYSDAKPGPRQRKPLKEIVCYDRWALG